MLFLSYSSLRDHLYEKMLAVEELLSEFAREEVNEQGLLPSPLVGRPFSLLAKAKSQEVHRMQHLLRKKPSDNALLPWITLVIGLAIESFLAKSFFQPPSSSSTVVQYIQISHCVASIMRFTMVLSHANFEVYSFRYELSKLSLLVKCC